MTSREILSMKRYSSKHVVYLECAWTNVDRVERVVRLLEESVLSYANEGQIGVVYLR
jgi:hypothetical protein